MPIQAEPLEPRQLLAVFTVSNLDDVGAGSLRQAILDANALAGADVIEFSPELEGAITLASELSITDDLEINGRGMDLLAIDGGNATRLFAIDSGDVTISDLTLRNGRASDDGGAIRVERSGSLRLSGVTLSGNESIGGSGGAVANFGTLSIDGSTFSLNEAGSHGGAIFSSGSLTMIGTEVFFNTAQHRGGGISNHGAALSIDESIIRGNTAFRGGGIAVAGGSLTLSNSIVRSHYSGEGGGIHIESATAVITSSTLTLNTATFSSGSTGSGGAIMIVSGTVTVSTSTITQNTGDAGGGICNVGTLTLTNSTLSGNSSGRGGGILNTGIATVRNSTITLNTSLFGGMGIDVYAGTLTLISSIVADNTRVSQTRDISGTLAPGSTNNLIGSAAHAGGLVNGVNGNIVGVDPLLGPLADNGGATQTHALLASSPALGAGINPVGLTTDQRAEPRVRGGRIDIGAFEAPVPPAPTGAASASDTHHVAWVDDAGNVLVYRQGWTYEVLQEKVAAPAAIGDAIIWVDPKDSLLHVAAPSAEGLLLFTRSDAGAWSFRNLTSELGASATPVRDLTHFISIRQGIVVIAGLTEEGRVVAFRQSLLTTSPGVYAYLFVDISADLESQGQTTPDLTGLTSYVPSWDTWHLAGVDTAGRIQSIWINTNNPSFTKWRVNNLSAITGAPAIASQLAVTLTSWGGINLTGLDQTGNLLTTWWVPRFGGQWAVSNLTTSQGGPPLVGGALTAFTTPWGGINYVGVDAGGTVRVYWWVPSFEGRWAVNPLLPASTPPEMIPTSTLTSSSSPAGTLSVYGLSSDGDVLRAWWQPDGSEAWIVENLTDIAEKV